MLKKEVNVMCNFLKIRCRIGIFTHPYPSQEGNLLPSDGSIPLLGGVGVGSSFEKLHIACLII